MIFELAVKIYETTTFQIHRTVTTVNAAAVISVCKLHVNAAHNFYEDLSAFTEQHVMTMTIIHGLQYG